MRCDRTRTLRLAAARALPLLSMLAGACAPTEDTSINIIDSTPVPTSVTVDPAEFLGGVTCAGVPGAMQSYVATVIDITDEDAPFALPSSLPTACSQRVQFRYVVVGHRYAAEVEGYDEAASELEPVGGATSGNRHMITKSGEAVNPRWETECGRKGRKFLAQSSFAVTIGDCETPSDLESSATAIVVRPETTLTGPACAAPGGVVAAFDVAPLDPAYFGETGLSCGDGAARTYPAALEPALEPGREYLFEIYGYEAGSSVARWASTCFATAEEGLTVSAVCDPLVELPSPPP